MEISSLNRLSSTLNDVIGTFDALYDKVVIEHNDKAVELTETCFDLHKKFYEQMRSVSEVCNDSINSTKNIIQELELVDKLQEFDINVHDEIKGSVKNISEVIRNYQGQNKELNLAIVDTQDRIKEEKKKVEDDTPHFDFLKQVGWDKLPIFESPGEINPVAVMFGQFAVNTVANAVNGIFQLINHDKTKKMDRFNHILGELSLRLENLLQVSDEFNCSLDKNLTNMESYMRTVEKLSKYSSNKPISNSNTRRILFMVADMIPETKELQKGLLQIKEQASENQQNLRRALIHINPRYLIENK